MDQNTFTFLIAIWGALTGTASATAHVLNWRNARRAFVPQIKVTLKEQNAVLTLAEKVEEKIVYFKDKYIRVHTLKPVFAGSGNAPTMKIQAITEKKLIVRVANYGQKSCLVQHYGFEYNDDCFLVPYPEGQVPFPHEFKPETYFEMYYDINKLADHLYKKGIHGSVKIRAVLVDSSGRRYKSKQLLFDSLRLKRQL